MESEYDREYGLHCMIQVFLRLRDNVAVLETSKFVRMVQPQPSAATTRGVPPIPALKLSLTRDLEDSSKTYPCTLAEVSFRSYSGQDKDAARVFMRKLRAGVNMLTARIGAAADEKEDAAGAVMKEIDEWLQVRRVQGVREI